MFAGGLDTYRDNNNDTDYAYAIKTNSSGNLIWTKAIDENIGGYSKISSVITTNDGGYAICGEGIFYNADDNNYENGSILYKVTAGFQACNETAGTLGVTENGVSDAFISITTANLTVAASQTNATLTDAGAIDNVCQSNALPLQLLSFNASLQNKSVNINWQTANEVNTNYFVVERSANGTSFTTLQQIAAKGNSSVTQTYTTTDLQPLPGTSYYRLKEVDKDGKTTHSSIASVTIMSDGAIVISPNPVQSNIRVIVQSTRNDNVTLQVVDMKGNILDMQKRAVSTGRSEMNIPATSLAKGVYVLKVVGNTTVQSIRFVKE